MTSNTRLIPAVLLTAVALSATPAMAQQRDRERGRRNQDSSENRSAERAVPRGEGAAPRADAQRQERRESAPAPRADAQPQERRESAPARTEERRQERQAESPRVETRRDAGNRRDTEVQRAVPRREAPRYEAPRDDSRRSDSRGYDSRGYDSRRYDSRGYRNGRTIIVIPRYERYTYVPRSYYRPYVFRPWFSIGFGIFAGYPVPYSYAYPYPVPVYGYSAPRFPVMIGPGSNTYGGVSLEIYPNDGAVYVDGVYAGEVREFDGSQQPLTLVPGTHRIDVEAPGYEPLSVDVTVRPGEVIPYRGDLRPY